MFLEVTYVVKQNKGSEVGSVLPLEKIRNSECSNRDKTFNNRRCVKMQHLKFYNQVKHFREFLLFGIDNN